MELDKFKYIGANARKLFPGHIEITFRVFNMAQTRYFTKIKTLDVVTKIKYFQNTYYCKNGICWFILDHHKYFAIYTDAGSIHENKWFGTLKL